MSGTGIEGVPNKYSYPRYGGRSLGYWYRTKPGLTDVLGDGIENIPSLPKCRVPVSRACTEKIPVPPGIANEGTRGTGIEFVPNLTGVFDRVLRPYLTRR